MLFDTGIWRLEKNFVSWEPTNTEADHRLFFPNQTDIFGIVTLFADNIIYVGKTSVTKIINKFKNVFHFGTAKLSYV